MTWGGVGEIFNPGQRHADEEKHRKRVDAKIPGSEGEPNSVDLDRGIVRITALTTTSTTTSIKTEEATEDATADEAADEE